MILVIDLVSKFLNLSYFLLFVFVSVLFLGPGRFLEETKVSAGRCH